MAGTGILICGMHRSGTSALGGALNVCGVVLKDDMPASALNPKGYFEKTEVISLHEELFEEFGLTSLSLKSLPENWEGTEAAAQARHLIAGLVEREFSGADLWAVKDPRLCRLVSLWKELPDPLAVAMIVRHPAEVCASLHAILRNPPVRCLLLWLRYVLEAERNTREMNRAVVRYHELLESPSTVMLYLKEELRLNWPDSTGKGDQQLHDWIDVKLKRQIVSKVGPMEPQYGAIFDLCLEVYDLLRPGVLLANRGRLDEIWSRLTLTDQSFEYASDVRPPNQGRPLTIAIPDVDAFKGMEMGGGWYHSEWFGAYNTEAFPWINHEQHGFIYVDLKPKDQYYLYDQVLGWLYTSRKIYPQVYVFARGSWLRYEKQSANPRRFYDEATGTWESVESPVQP